MKQLTNKAEVNSKAPKAAAIIIEVAQVASIGLGVRWNSSPGITTVYSRFSLNLVKGVESLSCSLLVRAALEMLWKCDASGKLLRLRPCPEISGDKISDTPIRTEVMHIINHIVY